MAYPPPYAPLGTPVPVPPRPVLKPSGWWYVAAVGVAVLGLVLAGYAVRQGFRDARDAALDATSTALGSDQTITINRPQSVTIAYSGLMVTVDDADRRDLIEQLDVRIEGPDGAEVRLVEYEGYRPIRDSIDGRDAEYLPLLTARLEQLGDYVISTRTVPGVNLDESAIVVSESPFRKLRDGLWRAVAFAAGGAFAWLLVTMILARTRGRARRAWEAAHPSPWGWAPPR